MKFLLSALALVLSFQAEARQPIVSQEANLTEFRFQKASELSQKDITSGTIAIDYRSNDVLLTLQPAFRCPANPIGVCVQVMPQPIRYQTKLLSRTVGVCNESIYTSKEDLSEIDGLIIEIQVVDNSTNTCPTFQFLPATSVNLRILNLRTQSEEIHTMSGTELQ